jgi:hypothetical protein
MRHGKACDCGLSFFVNIYSMERASPIVNLALVHSTACSELLDEGELDDAVRYCIAQGIEPPFPPCSKLAPEYARCVELAKATLSDYGWWEKRLKTRNARLTAARR